MRIVRRMVSALLCVVMLASTSALAVFDNNRLPETGVKQSDTAAALRFDKSDAVVGVPAVTRSEENRGGIVSSDIAQHNLEYSPSIGESTSNVSAGQLDYERAAGYAQGLNVTVPTTLSIYMDTYGGISCSNLTITNNSPDAPVAVAGISISGLNGWSVVDYASSNFTEADNGQHKLAIKLGDCDGIISAGGDTKTIGVDAKIPFQGYSMANQSIANVVTTVVLPYYPDQDWEYELKDGVITLTRYIGSSNDVVVHSAYVVGGKTYRTALGESYYGNGPFAGSSKRPSLTSITFEPGIIMPTNMGHMFSGLSSLTGLIGLENQDVSAVTDLSYTFYELRELRNLDCVSGWDIGHVTNMSYTFGNGDWDSLDGLRSWNTGKVVDMSGAFSQCTLRDLDPLSGWNTSSVVDMSGMFFCSSNGDSSYSTWSYLDATEWDLRKLEQCSGMFDNYTIMAYVDNQENYEKLLNSGGRYTYYKIVLAGVSIQDSDFSVPAGASKTLRASLNVPPKYSDAAVWTSDNTAVATVDNSGLVTGVSAGTVNITVTCGRWSDTTEIVVSEAMPEHIACDIVDAKSVVRATISFTRDTQTGQYNMDNYQGYYISVEPTPGEYYTIVPPQGYRFTEANYLIFECTWNSTRATFELQPYGELQAWMSHQNYWATDYNLLNYWGVPYVVLEAVSATATAGLEDAEYAVGQITEEPELLEKDVWLVEEPAGSIEEPTEYEEATLVSDMAAETVENASDGVETDEGTEIAEDAIQETPVLEQSEVPEIEYVMIELDTLGAQA